MKTEYIFYIFSGTQEIQKNVNKIWFRLVQEIMYDKYDFSNFQSCRKGIKIALFLSWSWLWEFQLENVLKLCLNVQVSGSWWKFHIIHSGNFLLQHKLIFVSSFCLQIKFWFYQCWLVINISQGPLHLSISVECS